MFAVKHLVALLAALLFTAAGTAHAVAGPAQDEKAPIEGTWTITSFTKDGEKEEASLVVTFKDGQYSLPSADGFTESSKGTYEVMPGEDPGQIDIVPAEGPKKDLIIFGIYRVEGDTMEACYDPAGVERPTTFRPRPTSGYVFVTYERKG